MSQLPSKSTVSDKAIHEAAKTLCKRQSNDAGWGKWSDLKPDDRDSFYEDVRAVLKTIKRVDG